MRSLIFLSVFSAFAAAAQEYPTRAVRMISGAPPGSPGDVAARIVAEPLAALLGQPVLVEHRVGGMNTIAFNAVARSTADGHTLGVVTLPWTVTPHLLPAAGMDVRELAPVRQVGWVSNVLVARPTAPFATVRELVTLAQAQPQRFTFASGGNGTPAHLSGELFRLSAAIEMRHVPFQGAVAGVASVMGEQVDMMFAIAPAVLGHLKAGRLRAIATPAPSRLNALPQIPTLLELGHNVDVRDWVGIVAPAGTSPAVIARAGSALDAVLRQGAVMDRLAAAGFDAAESNAETFGALLRAEQERWGRVIREAGIKAD